MMQQTQDDEAYELKIGSILPGQLATVEIHVLLPLKVKGDVL
jgi:hypothetical protein